MWCIKIRSVLISELLPELLLNRKIGIMSELTMFITMNISELIGKHNCVSNIQRFLIEMAMSVYPEISVTGPDKIS